MTRCLIIERSREDAKALCALLARYGFALDRMEDADAALDHCRQAMPDVIVMSEQLACMDSAEFLDRLKRTSRGPSPKVIVYQDAPDAGAIGRHIWSGAAECMAKPFDPDIIDLKLRQVGIV